MVYKYKNNLSFTNITPHYAKSCVFIFTFHRNYRLRQRQPGRNDEGSIHHSGHGIMGGGAVSRIHLSEIECNAEHDEASHDIAVYILDVFGRRISAHAPALIKYIGTGQGECQ